MISVRNLSKTYPDLSRGETVALAGIDFDAHAGEIFGLLGPNGAGKTSALRIITTLVRPTGGSVVIDGLDVLADPDLVRRRIGYVSANTAVYDRMSGWEMVQYFGRLNGLPEDLLRSRMEHLFERLEMQDTRNVSGAKMSTGMKQKVSIARALVHDPPVVIFDEATAGLDVIAARALLDLVAGLRDQGKCVVFSTHIMREAERLCDRVAVLHKGKIMTSGTLAQIRRRHGEDDLEEIFFRLIRGYRNRHAA